MPASYERNFLLARIGIAQNTNPTAVIDQLTAANSLNPANIDARTLLAQMYRSQNQTSLADEQLALVHKLQIGQP